MKHIEQDLVVPRLTVPIPGYQVAFSYRPAWREAKVGGDFYNLFALDNHRFGLVLGDVGGKGLEAAVLAARLQPALMALFLRPGATPASVLNDAQTFWMAVAQDRIATLFVAALDAPRGDFTYCCAGHEPPLVWRGGHLERLELGLPPLLPLPVAPYIDAHGHLGPGDLLFVFSDGLTEAGMRGSEGPQGAAGVETLLRRESHHSPEAILRSACQAAGLRAGGMLHDDIVMLALRRSHSLGESSLDSRRCRECPGTRGCELPPKAAREPRPRVSKKELPWFLKPPSTPFGRW